MMEAERRAKIQQEIAHFRELKYMKEQEKLAEE